jgi:signal transduction histidine kinase
MGFDTHQETAPGIKHSKVWRTTSRLIVVSLGVGLISCLMTEVMHYLLVPDIGRLRERLLAEGLSAIVLALLTAGLMHAANRRREAELLRMQVISEMNHHIRNALAAISLTTDSIQNQQCIRVIFDSVDHIEWTLREILPRDTPLHEEERDRLWFFRPRNNEQASTGGASAARH